MHKSTGINALIMLTILGWCSACDPIPAPVTCALQDETLSIAFKDPRRARAYLESLAKRLEKGEPEAIREAGNLVADVAGCLR